MRARRISSVGQLRKILKDKSIPDNAPLWVSISKEVERHTVKVTYYKSKKYKEFQIVGSDADA